MPRISPYIIKLSEGDLKQLKSMADKYTSQYRNVIRARIILYAAEGMRNDEIAARLDTPRQIVSKWRKRFYEMGIAGLEEQSRRGRPVHFSPRYRRRH